MQCPDSKKNVFSHWSWRGTKDAKRVLQDSEDSAQNKPRESLEEVENKYRKAMVSIAQLSNEKRNLEYQVDNLKDVIDEMEEKLLQNQTENRINSKRIKFQQTKLEECIMGIRCRDELLRKHGIIPNDAPSCDIAQWIRTIRTGVINTASAAQFAYHGGSAPESSEESGIEMMETVPTEETREDEMCEGSQT